MLKKVRQKTTAVKQNWHDQFAVFKKKFRARFDKNFPKPHMEIEDPSLELQKKSGEQNVSISKKIWLFWLSGLVVVALGYFLYDNLHYIYILLGAFIISLAMESVVIFWQRLTSSRGLGILITYTLLILFVLSGFVVIVPFFFSRGTHILQYIISLAQGIQTEILSQGLVAYIQGLTRIPSFIHNDIVEYVASTNSADLINTLTQNIGNIVNISSSYLKLIGDYAMNVFGWLFFAIGKIIIFFTLSVFFSLSLYEIKFGLKYLFRNVKHGTEKIDKVYSGVASWLKSQLLLCVIIATMTYAGLRILALIGFNLPQKGVLILIIGLLEVVPYLGPILGSLPAALMGLMLFGWKGLIAIVIAYTIIQQSEGNIVVPVLMSRTLGINATLVFVCMLFGGLIMGFLGVLLSVPIAVIISIICERYQKENVDTLEKNPLKQKKIGFKKQ